MLPNYNEIWIFLKIITKTINNGEINDYKYI